MSLAVDTLLPVAVGHEQEVGSLIGQPGKWVEPVELCEDLNHYIPQEMAGFSCFLNNGFKVYAGGTSFVEIATPECGTPKELVQYRRAAGAIIDAIFLAYATELSTVSGEGLEVRIQNRVIDSFGSRKASHMNIGLANYEGNEPNIPTMLAHQATRSFVTGAGYVGSGRLRYAQKIGGLVDISRYGYVGSMYRVTEDEGTTRFEDRCGDINISDWATWMHAGALGLAAAIARTPLVAELPGTDKITDDVLVTAKQMNVMYIKPDGTLRRNATGFAAVDFQQKMAELAMDKLMFYTEVSDSYYDVARALYKYCQTYRAILKGEGTMYALADKADWAAKMALILRRVEKDQSFGITRKIHDIKARATDLRYDGHGYQLADGKIVSSWVGKGKTLREKGVLANMVTDTEVKRAIKKAPTSTRAHLRAALLRNYHIAGCNWAEVKVEDPTEACITTIKLTNVAKTAFTDLDVLRLDGIKQKPELKS